LVRFESFWILFILNFILKFAIAFRLKLEWKVLYLENSENIMSPWFVLRQIEVNKDQFDTRTNRFNGVKGIYAGNDLLAFVLEISWRCIPLRMIIQGRRRRNQVYLDDQKFNSLEAVKNGSDEFEFFAQKC